MAFQPQTPPSIALTVGDPAGIGPEITLKLLNQLPPSTFEALKLTIIGPLQTLQQTAQTLGLPWPNHPHLNWAETTPYTGKNPGAVAFEALEKAVALVAQAQQQGQKSGLVTGPTSKTHWWQAGIPYAGQTEALQALAKKHWAAATVDEPEMLFVYKNFRLLLLTRHVPLTQVAASLTLPTVEASLSRLVKFLQQTEGLKAPHIGMMGLNPHAGEIGGEEEKTVLMPAMQAVKAKTGATFSNPLPADALFRGFRPEASPYDALVACYHDQGLIPMKLLAGFEAVNVTIGLPFLRTSVSHGVALDIAGQNKAQPESLKAALLELQGWLGKPLC